MSNFDPALSGHCTCGRPCYGQSTCTTCDSVDEIESKEEEEVILCCICEDDPVLKEGDMCSICKQDAEEAQADMWIGNKSIEKEINR